MRNLIVIAAIAAALVRPAAAQQQPADAVRLRWTGLAQLQLSTSSIEEEEIGGKDVIGSSFDFRRVRLGAEVAIRDWITGKIESDVAMGRLSPTDVWLNLQLSPGLGLRFGQFKKPFSAVELSSSSRMLPIERNVRIRGLADLAATMPDLPSLGSTRIYGDEHGVLDALRYLGRDIGAAVNGAFGRFDYQVGVFNGAGANTTDDNDAKSAAGRLVFRAPTGRPLRVGAAFSRRETATGGDLAGTAFEADVELGDFRTEGLHLLAEAAIGENLASGRDLRGVQIWAAWYGALEHHRIEGIEPLFRLSWADPNDGLPDDDGLLLTPGVNLYFFGRNRLMLNWDVFVPGSDGLEAAHALRAQAQLHF